MNDPGAHLTIDRRGRILAGWMLSAAVTASALWLVSGACHWRGYPAEHPYGRVVAAVLGILATVILVSIGFAAIGTRTPSLPFLFLAVLSWSVARLVTASLYPLGSDEAYHWQWARHLDWCYYDHPGMVAWIAKLFAPNDGEATATVRRSGIVLIATMPLLTAYFAWITLRDRDVAIRGAFVFMLTPILSGSAFLMPALPVLFFWLLSMIQFWRALESDGRGDWLLLGVFFGAALNCNFTTFLFPICALAYLAISPAHRGVLARRGPYLALFIAALCFLPVVAWNAQHEWWTFGFNFFKRHRDVSFHPNQIGLYLGELLLYVSPVLAVAAIAAAFRSIFRNPQSEISPLRNRLYLAMMGLGPLAAFLITSALLKARPHYAAPAIIPLIILFVQSRNTRILRRWYRPGLVVGLIMTLGFWCVLSLMALVPAPTMNKLFAEMGAKDPDKPTAELYGWPALGAYLDSSGERMNTQSRTVIMAISYAQASLAMHYSRHVDYAFSLDQGRSPYGQQFEIWGPLDRIPIGCDAIHFRAGRVRDLDAYEQALAKCFDRVDRVDTSAQGLDPSLRYFTIWKGHGYRGGVQQLPAP
jgi:hypothetical protein